MEFLTYLEEKDLDLQNVLLNQPKTDKTAIMIAFASFEFNGSGQIGGISLTDPELRSIIQEIKSRGQKVLLSFGGSDRNYFLSRSNLWSDTNAIASAIVDIILNYGFDGCDLNIQEVNQINVFAGQVLNIIKNIRQALPETIINLTMPAQRWNTYYESLVTRAYTYLDTINSMEYNIFLSTDYVDQIKQNMMRYIDWWFIPAEKMTLGLMPGKDRIGRTMSLKMTDELTNWAKSKNFNGVMLWNSNRDFKGQDGENPFAFTEAVNKIKDQAQNIENKND